MRRCLFILLLICAEASAGGIHIFVRQGLRFGPGLSGFSQTFITRPAPPNAAWFAIAGQPYETLSLRVMQKRIDLKPMRIAKKPGWMVRVDRFKFGGNRVTAGGTARLGRTGWASYVYVGARCQVKREAVSGVYRGTLTLRVTYDD